MAKVFRPKTREARILSQIESSRERERHHSISRLKECGGPLSNSIAMKLIETNLVETVSKTSLDEQLMRCIESLISADDFDVDYRVAPFRHVSNNPNIVSLYLTAFVIETLINHKDVVDIYGSDDEIYSCINNQVQKYISL
jgi:hypothetical protein